MSRSPVHRAIVGKYRSRYDELLAIQGGVCALCGNAPKTRRLNIDHDHNRCMMSFSSRQRLCGWCEHAPGIVYRESLRMWLCDFCLESSPAQRLSNKPAPAPKPESRPGFIYFIQAGDNGPVKIGWALSPFSRLESFRAAHWQRLELVHYERGTRKHEHALHRRFAQYRIHNEWFEPVVLELAGVRRAEPA